MSNLFFIADTHFAHINMLKYEPRNRAFSCIEDHDQQLIKNWNSVVGKRDVVWHLGDVAFSEEVLHRIIPQLNGRKRLVLGDHDTLNINIYAQYFETIVGARRFKKRVVISHIPLRLDGYKFDYNIHGHTHSKPVYDPDNQYFCVSVEMINLTPISLDEIRQLTGWPF